MGKIELHGGIVHDFWRVGLSHPVVPPVTNGAGMRYPYDIVIYPPFSMPHFPAKPGLLRSQAVS